MFKIKTYLACLCILFVVSPKAVLSNEINTKLSADIWGNPQSGEEVLQIQPLISIMRKLTSNPKAKLNVLYHGDDKGTKSANSLRGWLISLGLKSDRIILAPDSYIEDTIELKVQN
ncbi:MAG: hypothetical protein GXP19_02810 [Gammaproteobacteria bacterium]|nr:hypothetical protein [Gammaproteobacteria bacterium]